MEEMIETEGRGLRGSLYRKLKKKLATRSQEKAKRKEMERKMYKEMEPRYIRKKMRRKLQAKYAPKKSRGIAGGWKLPKAGQKSAGQNLFDAMQGKSPVAAEPKKRKKSPRSIRILFE